MKEYNPKVIEKKWQKIWEENKTFKAEYDENKEKYYALIEFPYPSGQGLHVGHPRPYTALDVVSRKKRLEGKNVLFPIGFDAFGLPTENYAIKNKVHPKDVTEKNIKRFTEQLKMLGYSFDWDRVINTTDPDYYKWTQWIFIQLFNNNLAYKKETTINWCPSCKIGLANEEVVGGKCERCGTEVVHKVKNQWMLRITEYADRLIDDLALVDYPEKVKSSQINWIGRSHGMEIDFEVKNIDKKLKVYTTRPDTLFGSTYMVIACEHPFIEEYKDKIENYNEVREYVELAKYKSDFERAELNKEKTGVEIKGIKAINPINGKEMPIWVSDYVLMSYGTGAIMAVPAHDDRDYEFAKKFNIPMVEVIEGGNIEEGPYTNIKDGHMINSDFLNGLKVKDAQDKMMKRLEDMGIGKRKKNFKLRDWVFSRQRYWGEPIPMVYCEECGWVPEKEENLPILLPDVKNYEPTDNGESPLSEIDEFVNTTCPNCGKPAKRETDTMPQWASSSWYYLRYMDPYNDKEPVSKKAYDYWGPVDWYNGGMEHTTLHLLYSRFWHKFLYDIGVVDTKEPYMKRTSHGMILGSDHQKMSKSRGNVVNPDEIVDEYGGDSLRCYEMFIGDFEQSAPWNTNGLIGVRKFLDKVWRLQSIVTDEEGYSEDLEILINQTIKKVSEDYESLKYNTALAQLMTFVNEANSKGSLTRDEYKIFLILLNPCAPHITEELWEILNYGGQIATDAKWPKYDENKLKEDTIEVPVQVNGKMRGKVKVSQDITKDEIIELAKIDENLKENLEGKNIVKVIYVPGKILNFVVK